MRSSGWRCQTWPLPEAVGTIKEQMPYPAGGGHPLRLQAGSGVRGRRGGQGAHQPGQHRWRGPGEGGGGRLSCRKDIPIRIGVNGGSAWSKPLLAKYGRRLPPKPWWNPPSATSNCSTGTISTTSASVPEVLQRAHHHGGLPADEPSEVIIPYTLASPRRAPPRMGTHQVRRGHRRPAGHGHRRHHPGVPVRRPGGGGVRRPRASCKAVRRAEGGPGAHLLPHLRPHPHRPDRRWPSEVERAPKNVCNKPITVAVMGCVVNGPGRGLRRRRGHRWRQRLRDALFPRKSAEKGVGRPVSRRIVRVN